MSPEIEQFLKENCNRLANGQCQTFACLKRGGYIRGGLLANYNIATCPAWQLWNMSRDVDNFREVSDCPSSGS